jgi:hypothetical protein
MLPSVAPNKGMLASAAPDGPANICILALVGCMDFPSSMSFIESSNGTELLNIPEPSEKPLCTANRLDCFSSKTLRRASSEGFRNVEGWRGGLQEGSLHKRRHD